MRQIGPKINIMLREFDVARHTNLESEIAHIM